GTEAHLPGHARLLAALAILGPLLGQVEAEVDQGVPLTGAVAEVDADLAALEFAQPAAPLPLHADGLLALLGEGGGGEDPHAARLAEALPDLAGQLGDEGAVVPAGLSDELLQALALAVVKVGDGLSVLALEVGEQAADVVVGVGALLAAAQRADKGLEERLQ